MKLSQIMKKHKMLIRVSSSLLVTGGICGLIIPILQNNKPKPKMITEIVPTLQTTDLPKSLPSPNQGMIDLGSFQSSGLSSVTAMVGSNKDSSTAGLTQDQLNKGRVAPKVGIPNSKLYSNTNNDRTVTIGQDYGQKNYGAGYLIPWYEKLFNQTINKESSEFPDTISNSFTHYNDRYGVKTNRNVKVVKVGGVDYFQDVIPLYNQGALKSLDTAAYGDSQLNWKNGYLERNNSRSNLIALSNQPLMTDSQNAEYAQKWSGWLAADQFALKPRGLNGNVNFYNGRNLETANFIDNFHNQNLPTKNFTKDATFKITNNNRYLTRQGSFNNNTVDGWLGGFVEGEEWDTVFRRWTLFEGPDLVDWSTYTFSHNVLNSHMQKSLTPYNAHRVELQPNHSNPWSGFGRLEIAGFGNGPLWDWITWNDYMGYNAKALTLPQSFLQNFYNNPTPVPTQPQLVWKDDKINSIRTVDVDFSNLLKLILSNQSTLEEEIDNNKDNINSWKAFITNSAPTLKKQNVSLIKTNVVENIFVQNPQDDSDLVDFSQQNLHTQNLLGAGNDVVFTPWNQFLKLKKGYTGPNWIVSLWKENDSTFSIGIISPKLAALNNNSMMLEMSGIVYKAPFELLNYGFFSNFQTLVDRPRWWFNTVLQNWTTEANNIKNPLIVLNNLLENFVRVNDYIVEIDNQVGINLFKDFNSIKTLAFFIFKKGGENLNINGTKLYETFKDSETDMNIINNPRAQKAAEQVLSNFYQFIEDKIIKQSEVTEMQTEVTSAYTGNKPITQNLYIPSAGIEDSAQLPQSEELIDDLIYNQVDVQSIQSKILSKFNMLLKQPNNPNFNTGDVSYDFIEKGKIDFKTESDGLKKVLFPSRLTSHYFNKDLFKKTAGSMTPSFNINLNSRGEYTGPENIVGVGKSETFDMFVRAQSETHVTNDRNIIFNIDDISSPSDKEWAKKFSVDDLKSSIIQNSDKMGYYNLVNNYSDLVEDPSTQYYNLDLDQIQTSSTPQLYTILMEAFDKVKLTTVVDTINFTNESGNPIPVDDKMTLKGAIQTSYKTPWNNKLIKNSLIIDLKSSLFERDTGNVFLKIMLKDFKTPEPAYNDSTTPPPPFKDVVAKNPDAQRDFDNGTFLYSQSFSNTQDNFVIHFNQVFKLANSNFIFDKNVWNELSVTNKEKAVRTERSFNNKITSDFRNLIKNTGNSTTLIESFDGLETLTSPTEIQKSIVNNRSGMQVKLKFTFRNWRNSDGSVETLKKITFNSAINSNSPENDELPFLDAQGQNIQWQGLSFETVNYEISNSIPGVSFGKNFITWLKDGFKPTNDASDIAYTNLINFFEQKQEFDAASIWNTQMKNIHSKDKTFGEFINNNISFENNTGVDSIMKIQLSSGFKILPTDSGFSLVKPFIDYNIYDNGKIQLLGQSPENITFRSWKQTNTTTSFLKTQTELLQNIQSSTTEIITNQWRLDKTTFKENFDNLNIDGRKLFLIDLLDRRKIEISLNLGPTLSPDERNKAIDDEITRITQNIDKITINNQTNGWLKIDVALLNILKFDTDFIVLKSGTNRDENFFITKSNRSFSFQVDDDSNFVVNIDNLRRDSKLSVEWNSLFSDITSIETKKIIAKQILNYWTNNPFEVFKDLVSLNGVRINSIDTITDFIWPNLKQNFILTIQNNRITIQISNISFKNLGSNYQLSKNINNLIYTQQSVVADTSAQNITTTNWWIYLIVGGVGVIMILLVLMTYFMMKKQHNNKVEIIKNDSEEKWMKD